MAYIRHLLIWLKSVMNWQVMDFSVAEGIRTEDRQKELVASGKSKTMNSKHLRQSTGYGHAVDLYPYPIDMEKVNKGDVREISRFSLLAGLDDCRWQIAWG
jgi:peptidoglycan L-alanyl-D-glutamate endopeptidase CwlK